MILIHLRSNLYVFMFKIALPATGLKTIFWLCTLPNAVLDEKIALVRTNKIGKFHSLDAITALETWCVTLWNHLIRTLKRHF